MKKLICLALTLLMVVPMLAMVVSANTTTYKTYAEAADGELLYKANFNGDDRWQPSKENGSALCDRGDVTSDNLTVTPDSADSTKANFTASASGHNFWGGKIEGLSIGEGFNYTVKFTLNATASKEGFGVLVDGYTGVYVNSGKGRIQKTTNKLSGHDYINYSGSKTNQEFAVEVDGMTISLYVKLADGWTKIDSATLTEYQNTNLCLNFYIYNAINTDMSNLEVYKGLAAANLVNDAPTTPETPTPEEPTPEETPVDPTYYNSAAESAELYKANFNGDEYWNPSSEYAEANAGWNWTNSVNMTVTPNAENSAKATVMLSQQGNAAWGADLKHLPLGQGFNYTIKFTVTRDANVPIGLLFDGTYGAYFYAQKARAQRNGSANSGHSYIDYDILNEGNAAILGLSPSTDSPSVQEFAIEVNGDETSYNFYVKDRDGRWLLIDSARTKDEEGFFNNHLCLYFYSYFVTQVDVSDLTVYKGMSLLSAENALLPEPDNGGNNDGTTDTDDGTTETEKPNKKPNVEAPELVTDAPAETNGDTTDTTNESGCASAITVGGVALVVAAAAGMIAVPFKRKKDE